MLAALILAQLSSTPAAPPVALQVIDPVAAYITPGQDEQGYRGWYLSDPARALRVKAFNAYLETYQVAAVVPTWQLLRTATMWKDCGAQPFEVPPTMTWPNIVQTLRYVRDKVVPAVGPVEPVSAYRNPALNQCAGGAPASAHQDFRAVDLVPLRPIERDVMMETLCAAHLRRGSDYQVGLGFYAFLRFHIDTLRYRKWGFAEAAEASPCRIAIVPPVASPAPPVMTDPLAPQDQPNRPGDQSQRGDAQRPDRH